jgi:hypothetical protein
VAENQRLLDDVRADPAFLVVMDVRSADADGADLDQHLVRARSRHRPLLQLDPLFLDEHTRTHRGRNFSHRTWPPERLDGSGITGLGHHQIGEGEVLVAARSQLTIARFELIF